MRKDGADPWGLHRLLFKGKLKSLRYVKKNRPELPRSDGLTKIEGPVSKLLCYYRSILIQRVFYIKNVLK